MSACTYARISRDRMGAGLGVGRQQSDCQQYAEDHGLGPVLHEFSDNDLSAYSGKPRPGYDALVAAMESGEVTTVVAWHVDRLTRQPAELEHLMAVAKRTGCKVRTVTAGELDPTSPDGMLMARITGSIAAYESAHKSRRITRKVEQMAAAGQPHGGRRRFGYEAGMTSVRESEAGVIRDMASRLLGGESLYSLAKWLDAEGIVGPQGATFTGPNLRNLMMRPHLAALRVHQGQVVGDGQWPAILSRGTHEALVAYLTDPTRRTTTSSARKYLLTGLATCAECGLTLRGRPNHKRAGRAYACQSGRHVHRDMERVDLYVEEAIVGWLEARDEAGDLAVDAGVDEVDHLRSERQALSERLDEVSDAYAAGDSSLAMLRRVTASVEAELAKVDQAIADAELASRRPQAVLAGMTGTGARAAWEAADLNRQRAIIDTLATVELVGSATGHKEKFSPERHVRIHWRHEE
jgi:DNA invertase Pin-like site-specific DNA recombinase